ncbi:hypothetical protein J4476_04035 [Candidatus Woesearchaeota archaeon]|nr:hypothetical protein [Candidatus Woesearchaeota archaeon]HIH26052.1 hypothetical protein [Nanoarchaeota archaeon]
MKIRQKKMLLTSGIVSIVLGAAFLIPSFISEIWFLAVISAILLILGPILMAVAFGDD